MTINNPFGFIYITTNLKNGKRYIGKKIFDKKNEWKTYLGSGVALKSAIKKYGKENFIKTIVAYVYSDLELCEAEKEIISFLNATNSTDFYNIAAGGEGYNYFGTDEWNHSVSVYCIDLNRAFKNSRVAEEITGENYSSIKTKCRNFGKQCIRKGYNWCFVFDMYRITKCSYSSIPVVSLNDNKIYNNWNHASKMTNVKYTRHGVITYERYTKMKRSGKDLTNKLLKLDDYFKTCEYTG